MLCGAHVPRACLVSTLLDCTHKHTASDDLGVLGVMCVAPVEPECLQLSPLSLPMVQPCAGSET